MVFNEKSAVIQFFFFLVSFLSAFKIFLFVPSFLMFICGIFFDMGFFGFILFGIFSAF